jgi:hypothetical protein
MLVSDLAVAVGILAVTLSRAGMPPCLDMVAMVVMMRGLPVVVRGRFMLGGGVVMMFRGGMGFFI